MKRRVEYLESRITDLIGERLGTPDAHKRTVIRETASAAHAELLLVYWMRETFGEEDLERIAGADLDRTMRYIRTVAHMLQEQADAHRAASGGG